MSEKVGHSWALAFMIVGVVAVLVFGMRGCVQDSNEQYLKQQELDHRIEMEKYDRGIVDKK